MMSTRRSRCGLRIKRALSLELLLWAAATATVPVEIPVLLSLALTQHGPPTSTTNTAPAVSGVNRLLTRRSFPSVAATVAAVASAHVAIPTTPSWASSETATSDVTADTGSDVYDFHNRDRKGNAQAVIRDDYWYILGKTPPQLLKGPLKGFDDPQWNAFGSCTTSETTGTNSCTYVSLNQRRPAYTKYASSIAYGAQEFQQLGALLSQPPNDETWWQQAESYVKLESPPPPAVDAELKMVLFATAMLTSPNFPGPSRELLVARFYANEVRHANREVLAALVVRDRTKARQAWSFGRDSWNSYFQVVARTIAPKVGEPFTAIV